MSSDYDPITGVVIRQTLSKPAIFKASKYFLKGYDGFSRGTNQGFLVGSSKSNGKISAFYLYADINRNGKLDSRDPSIGSGSVGPKGLGLYESMPVGSKADFESRDGYFSIETNDTILAAGQLF